MNDYSMDNSMPRRMPGQGDCPAGYRPSANPTQPWASHECVPIGPAVPLGGWTPVEEGSGAGYPPTAMNAYDALKAALLGPSTDELASYVRRYSDWLGR